MNGAPARYATGVVAGLSRWDGQPALTHPDRTLTFTDLLGETYQSARALADLGVERGDGVVLLAANPPEVQVVGLAASVIGARYTPVYLGPAADDVAHVLADAAPRVVLYDPIRAGLRGLDIPGIAATLGVESVFTIGPDSTWSSLIAGQPTDPIPVTARDEDIARLMYTGGTTGKPKGVAYSFATLDAVAAATGGPLPPGLRFIAATPMAHAAGAIGLGVLRSGGTVLLFDDFDADAVLDAIATASADGAAIAAYLYPPFLYRLMDHPRFATIDRSSIKFLVYGSAPMSPSRMRQAIETFGPILRQGYAQTEAIAVAGLSPADHARAVTDKPALLNSVGRPIPVVSVRIASESGVELPAGSVGSVLVSGPTVMQSYWNNPELTAAVLRDGWLDTGDLGYLDEDGYLYLTGRAKDLVIVNGHNCYTQPIENVLSAQDGVLEVAVLGVPSDATGEEVVAVVRGSFSEDDLRAAVSAELGPASVPARFVSVDVMPTATFGKPDKKALRASL